jgi:DNA primase
MDAPRLESSQQVSSIDTTTRARIQRIKREVALVDVVAHYVTLRASGANLVAQCPFHKDKIPSFTVYPASDTFYCFGCRAHGDVISFVQRVEHMRFPEALESLDHYFLRNGERPRKDGQENKAA